MVDVSNAKGATFIEQVLNHRHKMFYHTILCEPTLSDKVYSIEKRNEFVTEFVLAFTHNRTNPK